jgi:alkanesulfonate monooxygenase SsuD/methylene tetrahydromethanopterin reductase-like flavin-dependent oxidoreductase (luciferase family)
MAIKEFRFGVCVRDMKSRSAFADTAKGFESLGFDVLCVPDHLAAVAPFPALTAAAQASPTLRLGTLCAERRPLQTCSDARSPTST